MRAISENRFFDHYEPQFDPNGDFLEFEDVRNSPIEHVWTIVEAGDNLYASPGFHIVNRLGYVLTKRPWTDPARDAVYYRR